VDFSVFLAKSDVDDLKTELIEEFKTTDRVIFVINPPKGTQRGRFFVNGPQKESSFIKKLVAEAAQRLKSLETAIRVTIEPEDSE